MNKPIRYLLCLLLCLFACRSFSQSKLVGVNYGTGTVNINIPLFNVSYGAVSVPVSLNYSPSGLKTKDIEGTAGMGWNLVAGGAVYRTVRGLPDDITKDNYNNRELGWLYSNTQSPIAAFVISNNGITCSPIGGDIAYITSHFSYQMDTEPDLFTVSAPGLSCQLVYDHNINNFRPISYQDLKISYTTNADSAITSFTIINDKGIKYVFSVAEQAHIGVTNQPSTAPNFFANAYNQTAYGVNYTDAWYVSSITDVNGQGVIFFYMTAPPRPGSDPVTLYLAGSTTPTTEYTTSSSTWSKLVTQITPTDGTYAGYSSVFMTWDTTGTRSTGASIINGISGLGRQVGFNYSATLYALDTNNYARRFLSNVYENGCSSPTNYTFSYIGQSIAPGGSYDNTTLPDSSSKSYDYWGYATSVKDSIPLVYINPSDTTTQTYMIGNMASPGSSYIYSQGVTQPSTDTVAVLAGMLDTIRYAAGGMTTITYQSNDYYNVPTGTTGKGGGVRVRQIVDHDGINEANDIIRNYSYINPHTGKSSGKPLSFPSYAFTMPYSGSATGQTLWQDATVTSMYDLSGEDHTIYYGYVKESQTHAGSTLYQFYVPATNWDKTATPGCSGCSTVEWTPTKDYVASVSCPNPYTPIKNNSWSYPFTPNINYDFERGLLQSVTTYNDAGTKVSTTAYTYARSYSNVTAVPALKYEYNGSTSAMLSYGKYNIYTTTSELTATATDTVYDSPTLSQYQTSTTSYAYTSSNHKLLTQQSTTNSDNTTLITNFKYTKDYGATSSSNANVNALYNLVQENVNIPVETWSQTKSGSNYYTTAASFTLFNSYNTWASGHLYLPSQQYKLTLPNGETTFTPSSISGGVLVKDAGYQPLPINFEQYDYDGALITTNDSSRHHVASTIMDHQQQKPVLQVPNAAYTEFAFANFDTQPIAPYNFFTMSGTLTSISGHTGIGQGFSTTQTLSCATITKNAMASSYIFSCWVNPGATAESIPLTIKINSSNNHITIPTVLPNTWTYFQWKFTVTGNFTVSVTTSTNIYIDDVMCYPETSEVTYAGFDVTTMLPTATTNTNGISTYYNYDIWGRMLYTYGRYHNILQKNTYVTQASYIGFKTANMSVVGHAYQDTSFYLTASTTGCLPATGNKYVWNFNDGSPNDTTFNNPNSPLHSYDTLKTYNPTVEIISPVYGIVTKTIPVTVTIHPPTSVPLTFTNSTGSGNRDVSSFQFYQGGVLVYSFPPSGITGSTVLSGNYTVEVNMTSHAAGYGSIQLEIPGSKSVPPTILGCANYAGSGVQTYTFSISLPVNCPGLDLLEQTAACSGGGGQ
jgi:hypothetical protein